MTNFQNPTGVTLSLEKKKTLVELLAEHEVPLIEDDVYGELHFQPEYPLPALAFDKQGLVMHCSSFSKTLAPGYRIGWTSAGRFTDKVQLLKLMTTLSASIPVQAGMADYLQHGGYDKHLRKLRGALNEQLGEMDSAIRRWLPQGVRRTHPTGGYFLWLEFTDLFCHTRLRALRAAQLRSSVESEDRRRDSGTGRVTHPPVSACQIATRCMLAHLGH